MTNENRTAVKMASERTPLAEEWLRVDERGIWEVRARNLFAYLDERFPHMPRDKKLDAVADKIALEALDAMLANAKKRAR